MVKRSTADKILGKLGRGYLLASKKLLQGLHIIRSKHGRQVVFVAGVQRSGTNMMMDVLERSYETDVYHESNSHAFDNYEMRSIPVIKQLYKRSKAPCFVIKSLCELQDLTVLMEEFSPAKTVWVLRDYNDVVNSMLKSFKNHAKQILRISEDRTSDGWRSKGISDETHALLVKHVHSNLNDATAAALMWYLRNVLYFQQEFDKNPNVYLVSYEDLVTEPQNNFIQIFSFIGLDYTPRLSSKVFDSSVRRRDPPQIDQPVKDICKGLLDRFRSVQHVARVA